VENMLIDIRPNQAEAASPDRVVVNPDLVQDDVDRVFQMVAQAALAGPTVDPGLAQGDVDRMFG